MRILIAGSTYAPAMNGQAVFTTHLAEGLAKLGHTVMLLLDSPHGQTGEQEINGVLVEEIRSIRLEQFRSGVNFSPFPGKAIRRLFEVFQPEIVHVQDHYPSCWVTTRIALEQRVKLVGTNHFIPENMAPYMPAYTRFKPIYHWLTWQWMLLTYQHMDAITAQSYAASRQLQAQGVAVPIIPISCGIDLQRFSPEPGIDRYMYRKQFGIDPEKKVFLFLGRIDGEKRIDLLLRAMQLLPRDDMQLVIAGHGGMEASLRQMAVQLELKGRVHFAGFIPDESLPGLLNCVDVFVMPSEAELLSLSTLEAMACGRPVLLADAMALPELIRQGENGYLFKAGQVADLCCLLSIMADHPERWMEMGRISREISLMHGLDEVLHKFEHLYAQLLNQVPVADQVIRARQPV